MGKFISPLIPGAHKSVNNYEFKIVFNKHPLFIDVNKITIGSDKRRSST